MRWDNDWRKPYNTYRLSARRLVAWHIYPPFSGSFSLMFTSIPAFDFCGVAVAAACSAARSAGVRFAICLLHLRPTAFPVYMFAFAGFIGGCILPVAYPTSPASLSFRVPMPNFFPPPPSFPASPLPPRIPSLDSSLHLPASCFLSCPHKFDCPALKYWELWKRSFFYL